MKSRFVPGVGDYLPLLRMERAAAAKALKFSGLGGRGGGHRAVAGWDEDVLTLAVEAARGLAVVPESVIFASTSALFNSVAAMSILGRLNG